MTDQIPQVVFVKYKSGAGDLEIAKHIRPALINPTDEMSEFVSDIVHSYKSDTQVTYMGLADEEEYSAFQKIRGFAEV